MAMATAMAADVWVFCLNQFTTAPTAKIRVFDDVRYGKVRYIGALRTAHYALRFYCYGQTPPAVGRKRFAPAPGKTTLVLTNLSFSPPERIRMEIKFKSKIMNRNWLQR
jgi:hypothetical protein